MKIQTSDTVLIIAGKDKGKTGKVMRVESNKSRVVVERINIATKFIKKRADGTPGQIIKFEKSVDASNVQLLCPNCKKPTRVGYTRLANGKKARVCKKCKEGILNSRLKAKK